jgi:hypothetical protein
VKPLNTPQDLALRVSQILERRLNQRKLIGVENSNMRGKNEKVNKTFVQNNK